MLNYLETNLINQGNDILFQKDFILYIVDKRSAK